MDLKRATLREIADELRHRAKKTCSWCGGYGFSGADYSSTAIISGSYVCNNCYGTGHEPWNDLEELADKLYEIR